MLKMVIELDATDKRILFELEKNARITDVKLAKIIGKSKDAVRYRIKKLEEQEVITGYKTWIDFAKLGYQTCTFYMNLLNLPIKKEKLINEIKNNKKTYWIGVAEGAWNIGVSYFIKSNEEIFTIKHDLISRYKDIILDIRVTSLVSVSVHEKTFLTGEDAQLTTFTEKIENISLDEVDIRILKEIYWNAKENIAALSENLQTTVDIVRNRIKNFEKNGIIIRYSAIVDYHKIGYEFYKSFVYLKKIDEKAMERINNYVKNSSIIINLVRQIASWDLELVSFARNFAEYDNTIGKFTKEFAENVQKIETATMSEDIIFPCKKFLLNAEKKV
jgi:Lrp/AsnC family leucine-responsive transcriptional regulator